MYDDDGLLIYNKLNDTNINILSYDKLNLIN